MVAEGHEKRGQAGEDYALHFAIFASESEEEEKAEDDAEEATDKAAGVEGFADVFWHGLASWIWFLNDITSSASFLQAIL